MDFKLENGYQWFMETERLEYDDDEACMPVEYWLHWQWSDEYY
jgi:hypothetical protein